MSGEEEYYSLDELDLLEEETEERNYKPVPPGKETVTKEFICFDFREHSKYIDLYCKGGYLIQVDRWSIKAIEQVIEYMRTQKLPVKLKVDIEVAGIKSVNGEEEKVIGTEVYALHEWSPADPVKDKIFKGKGMLKKTRSGRLAIISDKSIYIINDTDTEMKQYAFTLLAEYMRRGKWQVPIVYSYCQINTDAAIPVVEGIYVMLREEAIKMLRERKEKEA